MLRQIYGKIIFKKDSILYHTSNEPFVYKTENEKPFLFKERYFIIFYD